MENTTDDSNTMSNQRIITAGHNDSPDSETLTNGIRKSDLEKDGPERDDTSEDHIDEQGFDNSLYLKTMGWSFFHDDRRSEDVYLLLATVADSSGVTIKRLIVGTWNNYTWECQGGYDGSIIQILAWLWIPEVNRRAFYDLEELWNGLREKQQAYGMLDRTDAPEDHNNGLAIEIYNNI
jgi:hypothetical protein